MTNRKTSRRRSGVTKTDRELRIAEEPRGETYLALLRFAAAHCESFSLVWRNQITFHHAALQIAAILEPYLQKAITTDEWPGTKLLGHTAVVRHYRITARSMDVLKAVPGLYSWLWRDYPEDIAFYSSGCKLWMGTISHENEAWFADPLLSRDEILEQVPGIVLANF